MKESYPTHSLKNSGQSYLNTQILMESELVILVKNSKKAVHIILLMAYVALARVKKAEQLQYEAP